MAVKTSTMVKNTNRKKTLANFDGVAEPQAEIVEVGGSAVDWDFEETDLFSTLLAAKQKSPDGEEEEVFDDDEKFDDETGADDDEDDDWNNDEEWEGEEEEGDWDPDFDEFDMPPVKGKKGSKDEEEDFQYEEDVDDDFDDLFGNGDDDDFDEDDF